MKFKVGDRVRAVNDERVGTAFRGLAGTVVHADNRVHSRYYVNFDEPPKQGEWEVYEPDHQGGYWSDKTLEWDDVTPEEEAAAIQSIVGAPPYCGPTQMHDPQGCDCGEAGS